VNAAVYGVHVVVCVCPLESSPPQRKKGKS
jgi:hypothetical protein